MQITCPSCQTSYALPDGTIGEEGRRVQCASCGTKWLAHPDPDPEPDVAAEPQAEAADDFDMAAAMSSDEAAGDDAFSDFAEGFPEGEGDSGNSQSGVDDIFSAALDEIDEVASGGTIDGEHARVAVDRPGEDIETLASRRRAGKSGRLGRMGRMPKPADIGAKLNGRAGRIALAVAAVLLVAAVPLRSQIVRVVPDLAGLYALVGLEVNLRGLAFDNLKTSQGYEKGVPYLIIEGEIENVSGRAATVPPMRFSIRTVDRREIYAWSMTPKKGLLADGEKTQFRTRVAAPPAGGTEVQVRFNDPDRRQASLMQ
ncbi:MAG: zinc-ribbon domain-containing protein [Hyphomicrobiales bacterium]